MYKVNTFCLVLGKYVSEEKNVCLILYNVHKIANATQIRKSDTIERKKKIGRCQPIQVLCLDLLRQYMMGISQKTECVFDASLVAIGRISSDSHLVLYHSLVIKQISGCFLL